jgi:hypothetical protein
MAILSPISGTEQYRILSHDMIYHCTNLILITAQIGYDCTFTE